jgi:hypothetical protein
MEAQILAYLGKPGPVHWYNIRVRISGSPAQQDERFIGALETIPVNTRPTQAEGRRK